MLGYWSVDQNGRRIARHWPPEMSDPRAVLARSCPHAPVGIVASTAVVQKVGGFDPRFTSSKDWDLWSLIAASGARFAVDPALRAF